MNAANFRENTPYQRWLWLYLSAFVASFTSQLYWCQARDHLEAFPLRFLLGIFVFTLLLRGMHSLLLGFKKQPTNGQHFQIEIFLLCTVSLFYLLPSGIGNGRWLVLIVHCIVCIYAIAKAHQIAHLLGFFATVSDKVSRIFSPSFQVNIHAGNQNNSWQINLDLLGNQSLSRFSQRALLHQVYALINPIPAQSELVVVISGSPEKNAWIENITRLIMHYAKSVEIEKVRIE